MLYQSCETINNIGPAIGEKLSKCGIKTIANLLFHFPYRYQDRTRVTPIRDLRPNEYCVVTGRVIKIEIKKSARPMLYCHIADKTGSLILRFFHFNSQQVRSMQESLYVRAFGEARLVATHFEIIHPEYCLLQSMDEVIMEETLTPIYSTTDGLSQNRLRRLITSALDTYQTALEQLEWMSTAQLHQYHFPSIADAVRLLHNPPPDIALAMLDTGTYPALQRLVFDELLAQCLSMQFARARRNLLSAPLIAMNSDLQTRFLSQLPFTLTSAQQRVSKEILQALNQPTPMLRLVQGDVGCGKTTVAAMAAVQAVAAGYQVALMAPTDLLTEQHTLNFQRWLTPLNIACYRLSGKMKTKAKKETLVKIATGECQILIGTHALFQEQVEFKNLGLIIIDEQHRFGVEQRLLLQKKGQQDQQIPHQLLMTATPIPRTLTMTQCAHLDISIIDELPPGRLAIKTAVISHQRRESVIKSVKDAIAEGTQVYWICTLIEESEKLQCSAAIFTAESLQQRLPKVSVGLVHGRLKALEKETIMNNFKQQQIDLLVATTVIEVGVDVPNASLMIIENAERLGLSQLHQLRGRVGRGNTQSYCLLLYQAPLSFQGYERLKIMRETTDGFVIAEKDLQLRGGGEVLGSKQTGYKQFKIASFPRDTYLLPNIETMARLLIRRAPTTAQKITQRWLGEFEQFLQG